MRIACLGWGSLTWDAGVLRCASAWHEDGPMLPLEFSRVSRDGRLTLVLTEGARPVPTCWALVDYARAQVAQEALAGREGCMLDAIGLWPGATPGHDLGASEIAQWAAAQQLDAVVWTALRPRFEGVEGRPPPSPGAAVAYLQQLKDDVLTRARAYVERAPAQVDTAFRQAIQTQLGWVGVGTSARTAA